MTTLSDATATSDNLFIMTAATTAVSLGSRPQIKRLQIQATLATRQRSVDAISGCLSMLTLALNGSGLAVDEGNYAGVFDSGEYEPVAQRQTVSRQQLLAHECGGYRPSELCVDTLAALADDEPLSYAMAL